MSWRRYLLVLAAFGSQRLAELAYSGRNERRVRRIEPDAPQAASWAFRWITVANLALFTLPALERALRGRRPPLVVERLGWSGALAGLGLRLWAIATLGQQWNVRALVPRDLHVIDAGPYRFIRHPNYLALMLEFAGLPLIGGAYVCAVALSGLNGLLLAARIADEEALLERVPEYRRLMGAKPRFLPRLLIGR